MAIPETSLLWLATAAVLASIGPFYRFTNAEGQPDRWTQAVIGALGVVLWAMVGLSASNVVVEGTSQTQTVRPLVVLGLGMAALLSMAVLKRVVEAISDDATEPGEPAGDAGWP